jgi:hypothetical protein
MEAIKCSQPESVIKKAEEKFAPIVLRMVENMLLNPRDTDIQQGSRQDGKMIYFL